MTCMTEAHIRDACTQSDRHVTNVGTQSIAREQIVS
jgi:hypothetical protein